METWNVIDNYSLNLLLAHCSHWNRLQTKKVSPHYFDAFVDLISMSNQIDSDLFEVGVCELGHVMQRRVTCVFEFDGVLQPRSQALSSPRRKREREREERAWERGWVY